MSDEPSRRQIAKEVALFALIVLVVGAVFVGLRVLKDGPRVLTHAPHRHQDGR